MRLEDKDDVVVIKEMADGSIALRPDGGSHGCEGEVLLSRKMLKQLVDWYGSKKKPKSASIHQRDYVVKFMVGKDKLSFHGEDRDDLAEVMNHVLNIAIGLKAITLANGRALSIEEIREHVKVGDSTDIRYL